ncbi:protein AAL-toxin resistant 7-like [Primulina tabacum]|uniref:protein AAL-toxin resistant 7-like n=1 Tax=Primulina tabacum TaxID=48773 RepID=UPI003F594B4F
MRAKSSSPHSVSGEPETSNLENMKEFKEPRLSNAYVGAFVKQLTSSKTKDSENSYEHRNIEKNVCDDIKQEKSNQPVKKQVRRRLHVSRPYKERLLNMAEARKEIVAALRFHRANMKQAGEKHQKLESGPGIQALESSTDDQVCAGHEGELKSGSWNSRIYASNYLDSNLPNYCVPDFSYSAGFCYSYSSWPISPNVQENLNFALPSRALGLNLNLHDFNNIDIIPFHCGADRSSIYSSSSPVPDETPCVVVTPSTVVESGDSSLYQVMDDEENADTRSTGEQHQMQWNDGVNSVDSSWLLRNMEIGNEDQKDEDSVASPFDEVLEVPAWLNANESCLQRLDDQYLRDPTLPCMEMEDIEGMDGDWFA